jgi:N-carbamoyl-L-amino-acid hydrolase
MITAAGIARRLSGLAEIGVGPAGVVRLAWTPEDAACREWFSAQARELGLSVERDPAGNLWARPPADPPWWAVGSHLDSVNGGGRFDGPLGVACGFEIASAVEQPLAVLSFADEEGARFNTPTFGSKALAGRLDLPAVLDRVDRDGVSVGAAMRSFGIDPEGVAGAPAWADRLAGFVEIHIEQSTELARLSEPAGVVSGLASRRRLEVVLRGRADHVGTTPRGERRDALSAAARLIVVAEDLAAEAAGLTVTTSRILTEPNAPTTIAALVRLWIDARALDEDVIDGWQAPLERTAAELAERSGVEIVLSVASRTAGRPFSERVRAALGEAVVAESGDWVPELVCFAGHDAGVVAERVPAAMVLVRNETGVSHSPFEDVDLADAAQAARVVARALAALR